MTIQVCQIQIRQGTSVQWVLANPVLLEGEFGLETNTRKVKLGDGVHQWNDLRSFPILIGHNEDGSILDTVFPFVGPALNIASANPTVEASLNIWLGDIGSNPEQGFLTQVMKSGGNIIAPTDPTTPFNLYELALTGYDTGAGAYNYGALIRCQAVGAKTGTGDWPTIWYFAFTSDGGSALDSFFILSNFGGFPAFFLQAGPGGAGIAVESTGRAMIVDGSGFSMNGLVALDLGLGGIPDDSSQIDCQDTGRGFLVNRVTTVEMLAIPFPANGLLVFNTDVGNFRVFRSGAWLPIPDPFAQVSSGCKAWATTPIATTSNVWTTLGFDHEYYDTDAYHDNSVANWHFVVPVTGFYHVGCNINWSPSNNGARQLRAMYAPGGITGPFTLALVTQPPVTDSLFFTSQSLSTVVFLPVGSIVWFEALQHSGGALNIVTALNSITDPAANSNPPTGFVHLLGV